MSTQARGFLLLMSWFALVFAMPAHAAAQQQPSPSPSPSPASGAAPAPVWHNPPNTNLAIVDPCGGPKELLNKFGPTPCVYVEGEGMVSAGYANINTHGALQITGNGPLGLSASVPVSGNASVYPALLMAFGVTANSQLQITPPSQIDLHTQRFGTFSAASNASFNYKQRVFFSPTKYTQLAVDLGYIAPTGGGEVTNSGPAYQIQLDFAQPFSQNLSLGIWWTFKNASTSLAQSSQRGWSVPLGLYLAWSPANSTFEFLPVVYHDFNPNRTIVLGQAVQLLSRRLSIAVSYGGTESSGQSNGPFAQVLNFSRNGSPRILEVNLYYLINQSDLPPQPPPPAPTPTP